MTPYYSPKEAAARLRISIKTLANWRSDKTAPGPKFLRIGNRILYPVDALEAWLAKSLHATTQTYRYRASTGRTVIDMTDTDLDRRMNDLVKQIAEIQGEKVRRQLGGRSSSPA